MKVNLQEIEKLVNEDYISKTKHLRLDLWIYNYTPKTQFSRHWDKYTEMCRGLITDSEGNIIARPFKKFFNYGEDSTLTLPTEMPVISEKMDGSLGIQYYEGDEVFIATRGSFLSDQALWATGHMKLSVGLKKQDFLPGKTYLYEIIYPSNRIVVDYHGAEGLYLLAVIDTDNGDETYVKVEEEAKRLELPYSKRIHTSSIEDLIEKTKTMSGNEEGCVFHWPNHKNLRIKIKSKEYVRLHKLLTEFSSISIWEVLKEQGNLMELLDQVPDEFYDWVKKTQEQLMSEFKDVFELSKKALIEATMLETRKEQAQLLLVRYPNIASYVFVMLDGKDPSKMIWQSLRPKYQKPFSKIEE